MMKIAMLATVLALLVAPVAMAQPSTPSLDQGGIIERIDEGGHVVVLQGGRMYRVTPATVLYVNNQPVPLNTLRAGQTIVVRSGEPVMFQNGQYVVLSPGSATVVAPGTAATTPGTTVTTSPGSTVTTVPPGTVTATPSGTVATAPGSSTVVVTTPGSGMVKQTLYGQVSDVDRDEVKIKTDKDSFEVRLPPGMSNQIRKGDNVQIDLTYSATSPSALPRR